MPTLYVLRLLRVIKIDYELIFCGFCDWSMANMHVRLHTYIQVPIQWPNDCQNIQEKTFPFALPRCWGWRVNYKSSITRRGCARIIMIFLVLFSGFERSLLYMFLLWPWLRGSRSCCSCFSVFHKWFNHSTSFNDNLQIWLTCRSWKRGMHL